MSSQYEDNVERLVQLLKERVMEQGGFKEVYDGDPDAIPDFNMPCLVVELNQDITERASFGEDDIEEQLLIKVILDKKDDYDAAKVKSVGTTRKRLRNYVAARGQTTGTYLPGTIKEAIREFGTQGVIAIAETMTTQYGVMPRMNDVISAEAHVTFSIQYSADVDEAM